MKIFEIHSLFTASISDSLQSSQLIDFGMQLFNRDLLGGVLIAHYWTQSDFS